MKNWTITDADGAVLAQLILRDDVHPSDPASGWAWKSGQVATQTSAQGDPAAKSFNGSAWVDDAAKINAMLDLEIDRQREQEAMRVLTRGTGKALEYQHKAREVTDYRGIAVGVLNALSTAQRRQRFPFLMAEVDLTGDTLAAVVTRVEAGIAAAIPKLAAIAAKAQRAKRGVRSASGLAAKQVAAKVSW